MSIYGELKFSNAFRKKKKKSGHVVLIGLLLL